MNDVPNERAAPEEGRRWWTAAGVPAGLAAFLVAASFQNFLLFHTLAELFSVITAVMMAVVAWQTYPFSRNGFLMFLACGFFWVGATDLVHTLIFKGMNVYETDSADPATQFWLVGRCGQALLLLAAPLFLDRQVRRWPLFAAFGAVFVVIYFLIVSGNFPAAYVENQGLTPFKVASEYVIIALLAGALVHMFVRRATLGPTMLPLIAASILLTIAAELAFTLYLSVVDAFLVAGHVLKLLAFWLIFEAIVRDSLVEPYHQLEARVAQRTLELEQEMTRRFKAERDIRRSEAWLRGVIDHSPDMITVKAVDGRYLLVNTGFERFWGLDREQVVGRLPEEVLSAGNAASLRLQHGEVARTGQAGRWETEVSRPDGGHRHLLSVRFPILDSRGQVAAVGDITVDVTDRKQAEAQVRHSQKLQALGDLAGGMAHEINNLLVPVLTLSNALLRRIDPDDPNHHPMTLINTAGLRARDIVAQVLAFSRQDTGERTAVDIGAVLASPLDLVRSTVPSSVEFKTDVPAGVGTGLADAGQMATVLVNLVSNAVDALEGRSGEVSVVLGRVEVDAAKASALGLPSPGPYARLRVADSGTGMDAETVGRIFDPFFSTKEVGKGTGLGLSIVHGVVAGHQGVVDVTSRLGVGTRIDVYLPILTEPDGTSAAAAD